MKKKAFWASALLLSLSLSACGSASSTANKAENTETASGSSVVAEVAAVSEGSEETTTSLAGMEFTATFGTEDTQQWSQHSGYLAEYPCETKETLTLVDDQNYVMKKELHSTEASEVEIASTYEFTGTYSISKTGNVVLSPAETCTFSENYGSLDGNSILGNVNNKEGDETTDPSSLDYFNTDFIACTGNAEEKIGVDVENHTFEIMSNFSGWYNIWNANKPETQDRVAKYVAEKYEARPLGEIVYYGASNFRMWENMEADMAPYKVQNHGVGGSIDVELMKYADTLLYPFQPKVVFIQTGSNDYTDGQSLEDVMANKREMYSQFLENLPEDAQIIIMAGLPLPSRAEYWDLTQQVNAGIAEICEENDRLHFVDATDAMLTDSGEEDMATGDGRYFNPEIFIQDGIHLTQEGHDLWTPYMLDELKKLGIEA